MARSKLTTLLALLGAAGALLCLPQCDQVRTAAQAFTDWMGTACSGGEKSDLEGELRRLSSRLEPEFEGAFLRGPIEAEEAPRRQSAQKDWQEMITAIKAGKTYGLTPQEITRLQSRDADSFAQSAVEQYTVCYRSAAIAGLGVIATDPAVQFLERIGSDVQYRDYWVAARLALERARRIPPP
jgi:hypothetical protein